MTAVRSLSLSYLTGKHKVRCICTMLTLGNKVPTFAPKMRLLRSKNYLWSETLLLALVDLVQFLHGSYPGPDLPLMFVFKLVLSLILFHMMVVFLSFL